MPNVSYVLLRVGAALLAILVAATLNFALFRLAPGDPAQALARVPGGGAELQQQLRADFGLDEPVWRQYALYLKGLATGDLGVSFQNRKPVVENLWQQLRNTIPMVLLGTIAAIAAGWLVGVIAAVRRKTTADHLGVGISTMMYSLPPQWVGLILIVLLGGFLPSSGMQDEFLVDPSTFEHLADVGSHMALPALTLGLTLFGQFALITRSAMLESLGEDYVLTARAKGLPRWAIVRRHALRNAMLPIVTLSALSIGYVVGGALLIEVVFSWPGIGLATYESVAARDYPMLQGQFLVLVVAVVVCNLIADLILYRLDPRLRAAA
jgi:ABC-type dipeptide/oligopeptide/nickel transport system permease component